MPFFSIIIPSYNRAHIVSRSINSVLNQSFQDFEIIVVDDGSIDNSKAVINGINDSRIHYLWQENKGVCAARNNGASEAKGNFLVFLDSDDYALTNWLNDFYDTIMKVDVDFVFCDMKRVDTIHNHEKIVKALYPYSETIYSEEGLFMSGTFCIKKECFELIGGFDTYIKFGEFTEFYIRAFQLGYSRAFTKKTALVYEASLDGGGINLQNKVDSNLYILEKHKYYFSKHVKDWINYFNVTAHAFAKIGNLKLARNLFIKSLFKNPFQIKIWVKYLICCNQELVSKILK